MTDALSFLKTRRSRPAKLLTGPVPDDGALLVLLEIAARSPDHGKLEPWRFIVLRQSALRRLGNLARDMALAAGFDVVESDKAAGQFDTGTLAVAVIECQKPSAKVPSIEQSYSAGAVCLSLLNASLAAGWGANWLSGWASHTASFREQGLQLTKNERIAGFIHIGTGPATMPDRLRPNITSLTTWPDR